MERKKLENQEKARIKAQVMSSTCCMLLDLYNDPLPLTGKGVKKTSKLDIACVASILTFWVH